MRYDPDSRVIWADRSAVEATIRSIEIRDPIKGAFDPKLEFNERMQTLEITIHPLNADGSGERIRIMLSEAMPPFRRGDEGDIVEFIRYSLVKALTHELDESLFCGGRYVNHPHPERREQPA